VLLNNLLFGLRRVLSLWRLWGRGYRRRSRS
jgi:hypothetical protein